MTATSVEEISSLPWHVGGTSMPDSYDPRQNVWSQAAPGDQSGQVVAKDCRPVDARLIAAAPEMFVALQAAQKRLEQVDDNSTEAIAVRLVIGIALAGAVQS